MIVEEYDGILGLRGEGERGWGGGVLYGGWIRDLGRLFFKIYVYYMDNNEVNGVLIFFFKWLYMWLCSY